MLYGFLVTLFVMCCFLLMFIIMLQEGKNSLGLGGMGGGAQMLFGGSGGQDIFQKTTWVLGAIFLFGSLALTLMKSRPESFSYLNSKKAKVEQTTQKTVSAQPTTTEKA